MVVYILQIFIRSTYIQNLKYNVKTVCIFHLILVDILSILLLSVKNRGVVWGGGGVCLTVKIRCVGQKLFVDSPLVMLWILALGFQEMGLSAVNPLEKGKSVTKIHFFRSF